MRTLAARTILSAMLVVATVPLGKAAAVEFGSTPNYVYSLWTNINDGLVTAAPYVSKDHAWRESLTGLTVRKFSDKVPADVLAQVSVFRSKLERLIRNSGIPPVARYDVMNGDATPIDVARNSGHVLDGLVWWIIRNSPREQLVMQLYTRHEFQGKTPSDVFGLFDLASRRLDRLLVIWEG